MKQTVEKIVISILLTLLILCGVVISVDGLCRPGFPLFSRIFFGIATAAMTIELPIAILFVWRN